MQEIEFRGISQITGEWEYGYIVPGSIFTDPNYLADYWIATGFENQCYPVMELTISQYTGLKDRNEKKIFNGDIVSRFSDTQRSVVEFQDGCFVSIIRLSGFSKPKTEILCNDLAVTEVIGNIYQNPELLTQ